MNTINKLLVFALLCSWFGCVEDPVMDTHLQNAKMPAVSEITAEEISYTSLTLRASIEQENGAKILECGICWSQDEQDQPIENMRNRRFVKATQMDDHAFTTTLSNLKDNTKYYVYAYAINQIDTAFSKTQATYTTISGIGEVSTAEIVHDNVHATSVVVSGKVKSQGSGIDRLGFYLKEKNPLIENNIPSAADSTILYDAEDLSLVDDFTCEITHLKPETWYYVRAFALNEAFGEFAYTVDSFLTTDGKPVIGLMTVDSVSFLTADFSAEIIAEGDSALTEWGFCWGDQPDLTIETADTILGEKLMAEKFIGHLDNLESNVQYYVRAFITNHFGTVYSENTESFFTINQLPNVLSLPIDVKTITAGSATISGQLQNEGMSAVEHIGFCWSVVDRDPKIDGNDCYTIEIPLENITEDGLFSYTMTGLTGDLTYYVNVYATNNSGTQYGSRVQTFNTPMILTPLSVYDGAKRSFSAVVSLDDEAYVIGGDLGGERTRDAFIYNAERDEWALASPCEKASSQMAACERDGHLYIFGGIDESSSFSRNVDIYLPASNTWTSGISLPVGEGRFNATSFVYRDTIYLLGGAKNYNENGELWQLSRDGWQLVTDTFPAVGQRGVAIVVDDQVYAGLGTHGGLWTSSDSLKVWEDAPGNVPQDMGIVSSLIHYQHENENSLIMVDDNGVIWVYDLATAIWTSHKHQKLKPMNNYHIFQLKNQIYILGQDRRETNIFMRYDPIWDQVE